MKKIGLLISTVVIMALQLSGCSTQLKPDGLPKLHPTVLTLTQDGTPLAGASVSLFAENEPATWTIGGTTDESGNVTLMTHGKFPGVPAGKYKVCVFKLEMVFPPGATNTDENAAPVRPEEYDLVDVKLKSPVTTTLTLEIVPGKNHLPLDVGKPIRLKMESGGA